MIDDFASLARRPTGDASGARSLKALLADLLLPYPTYGDGRIAITGDDQFVVTEAVTALALVFHELATNALRYGGLADPEGRVDLIIAVAAYSTSMVWAERGEQLDHDPFVADGFGATLTDLAVSRQLLGTLQREWRSDGLVLTITIPSRRLAVR